MRLVIAAALAASLCGPASAADAPAGSTSDKARDKVICKRQIETGSFAKAKKICKTRYDWNRVSEDSKQMTRDLQDTGMRGPRSGG